MPVQRDWLIILLSGQQTLPVISFNSFDDILSYPELDLGFNWPIILAISVVDYFSNISSTLNIFVIFVQNFTKNLINKAARLLWKTGW